MRNFLIIGAFFLFATEVSYSQSSCCIEGMDYVYAACKIIPTNDWPVTFYAIYRPSDTITINLKTVHSCVESMYQNAYYSPRPFIDTPNYFYKVWGHSQEVEMQHNIFEKALCEKIDKYGIKRKYRLDTGELLTLYLVRFFGLVIDEISEKDFFVPDGLNSEEFPRIKYLRVPISINGARKTDIRIVLVDENGNVK